MDNTTFDIVARNLSMAVSRRSAFRGLVAGALAISGGAAVTDVGARKRRTSRKGMQLRAGDVCQTDKQCWHISGNQICGSTRIFSDDRMCCGGLDALCEETGASGDSCCYGYLCASGRCIIV